jgi:Flp pilus assembly protein TadG
MTGLATCRRGAATLEFALVAPLFLALSFGTLELAHWAWGAAATRDLAARAARCIAVTPVRCHSAAATIAAMADDAPRLFGHSAISFEKSACGIRVTVHGGFPARLTPGLGETSASACAG